MQPGLTNWYFFTVVTIILGLDFFKKQEAYYTVIGYAVFLVLVLVVMEISKYIYGRTKETIHEGIVRVCLLGYDLSQRTLILIYVIE